MARVHFILNFLMLTTSLVLCYCPHEKIRRFNVCELSYHCYGTIRDVNLPFECQGSTNYNVTVALTLEDAVERFDDKIIEMDILKHVITFTGSGQWIETNLSFLRYMPSLKKLYLVNNQISRIIGNPFYHLSSLEEVDLSHNHLTDIVNLFQFEAETNKLQKLSLAFNSIEEIPGDAFVELTALVYLDLSNNLIKDLSEEPFLNLTNLETLKLDNNQVSDLNGALNKLFKLRHLYIRNNHLQHISMEKSLEIIGHLEVFDASGNQLENLKPFVLFRHMDHIRGHFICKIILSENQIISLPNATTKDISLTRYQRELLKKHNVQTITELDLSKNKINHIEYNAFKSIVELTRLDLSANKLNTFIVNNKDLVHIIHLNLSRNHITHLYFETFSSMPNLQNLDLSFNEIDYIPEETFIGNNYLKYVNMTHNIMNRVEQLPIKMFHRTGGVLDLSNNGLTQLTISIGQGLHMKILILQSNKITDATSIKVNHQIELHYLDMNWNLIEQLNETSLYLPKCLISLDLSHNKIHKVGPASFHRLSSLKMLRLGYNNLDNIDYGMFQGLKNLISLDLSYNRIQYLDSKVLIDMKSLKYLSLRHNGMYDLDYKAWLGHKYDVQVLLDGNNFLCDWLSTALSDYNSGYSRMKPTALEVINGHSLEGISCKPLKEMAKIVDTSTFKMSSPVKFEDRLLVIAQKILDAINDQTYRMNILFKNYDYNKIEKHNTSEKSYKIIN